MSTTTTMQTINRGCRFAWFSRWTRIIGAGALSSALLVGAGEAGATPSEALQAKEQADYKTVVMAKVEIKQSSGKVLKSKPQQLDLESEQSVQLESDGHVHDVQLQVKKKDDAARKLGVTLAYDVDGEAIIAPFEYDTTAKKREILRIDGGLALAVTLTPKKIKIEAPEPDNDIEVPDGENPLDGLK